MQLHDKANNAVRSAYRAAMKVDSWSNVLSNVSDTFGGGLGIFYFVDRRIGVTDQFLANHDNSAHQHFQDYATHHWQWDPMIFDDLEAKVERYGSQGQTAFYSRLKAFDLRATEKRLVFARGAIRVILSVSKGERVPFSPAEIGMLNQIEFHLRAAIEASEDAAATECASAEDIISCCLREFDLTTTEANIVSNLSAGLSTDRIAAAFGISRGTLRWHLKNIYAKTSTRNQIELVGLTLRSGRT